MSDGTVSVEVELTKPVADQVEAAAGLVNVTPQQFIDTAILNRLQAVDNILSDDALVELPDDFDHDAWRARYENIRRPETFDGGP